MLPEEAQALIGTIVFFICLSFMVFVQKIHAGETCNLNSIAKVEHSVPENL